MSEITRGAIGMPFEMAMESELSRRQFHSIAQALLVERDQLKAENEALRREREGKVLCDLELFQGLRDTASQEAEEHRKHMAAYRPQRQEVLDYTVRQCDVLIDAAIGKGEQS